MDLESRREKQICSLMYKVMSGLTPHYLRELFVSVHSSFDYNLRCSDVNLKIPLPQTNYLKRSFAYTGSKLWNDLPLSAKQASSVDIFNNILNSYS